MHTLGSINFANIPVASGGAPSVTGANEGLILNAGNVQLGGTVSGAALITAPRQISFDPGAALLLGEALTGNNLNFDIDNGVFIDGRDGGGGAVRYHFTSPFLEINSSGIFGISFKNAFPSGGGPVMQIGWDSTYTAYMRNLGGGSTGFINNSASDFDFQSGGANIAFVTDVNVNGLLSGFWASASGVAGIMFGSSGFSWIAHDDAALTTGWYNLNTFQDEMTMDDTTGSITFRQPISANGISSISGSDIALTVSGTTGISVNAAGINVLGGITGAGINMSGTVMNVGGTGLTSMFIRIGASNKIQVTGTSVGLFAPVKLGSSAYPTFELISIAAGAVALDTTQSVSVTIGGVAYKLALAV